MSPISYAEHTPYRFRSATSYHTEDEENEVRHDNGRGLAREQRDVECGGHVYVVNVHFSSVTEFLVCKHDTFVGNPVPTIYMENRRRLQYK